MLKDILETYNEVNQSLLGKFKIQAGVAMYIQLHGYDDFNGLDLPNDVALSAISKRIYG